GAPELFPRPRSPDRPKESERAPSACWGCRRRPTPGLDPSSGSSILLIDSLPNKAHPNPAGGNQSLGMSNVEKSARREALGQAHFEFGFRLFIEIDHHVAAENRIVKLAHRPVLKQVKRSGSYERLGFRCHDEAIGVRTEPGRTIRLRYRISRCR